jgi:hypothetical protein
LFIFTATVLSVFDINKVTINGVVQEPKCEFSSGVHVYVFLSPRVLLCDFFFRRPKPFLTELKPRSDKAEALIRSLELS